MKSPSERPIRPKPSLGFFRKGTARVATWLSSGHYFHAPLWLVGCVVWGLAFFLCSALMLHLSARQGLSGRVDWLGLCLMALAPAGLVVLLVQRIRERPSPEQLAALSAIFQAGPGTRGAIVVTRNGVPEVIATVRSKEEYLEMAASGTLPHDHHVYLPSDA